jgi:hypothetical protein
MPSRRGRKSAAQTPAPKKDRIYGSKRNPAGSASSEKRAKNIQFSAKTENALKEKLKEFREKHSNKKVTLSDLKAVYRRGSGAYSSSHRPTISGGVPNSRNAWAMARVNKFLKKAAGEKVKAAYVQDDDLMEEGGIPKEQFVMAVSRYQPKYLDKGGMTDEEKKETYKKWRSLVNMSRTELERFYNSEEGKKAGLSASEAASQGIDSGRESARWIMKMKETPVKDWTPAMWRWAKKQISFISRMRGNEGKLYDEKGEKTRKHLSLLIWGHNPKKHNEGGEIMAEIKTVSPEKAENRLQRISERFKVSMPFLRQQLKDGMAVEMEHTDNKGIARKIAIDHLSESPIYYQLLAQMEDYMTDQAKIDEYYGSIYAKGGVSKAEYSFATPTGKPTKLNYIQQVLVRTTAFKNWFGDWETAAKNALSDPTFDFKKHYQNVSKVIDPLTLEPQVVYHGSNAEKEFYEFDATRKGQTGRPYAYFADNREYSLNFTMLSQRNEQGMPLLYSCFLNIRNPFFAIGNEFTEVTATTPYWTKQIVLRLFTDKKEDPNDSQLMKQYVNAVKSQLDNHFAEMPENYTFWMLMAKDINKDFKSFLIANGYDGVRYSEELKKLYDPNNPAEFTNAWTIFDAGQTKLADGRNLDFNPMSKDIRMETGGNTTVEDKIPMSRGEQMRAVIGMETAEMDAGGYLVGKQNGKTVKHNDASKGGVFHGRSHAEGGIKGINHATGQPIEVEGYEMQVVSEAVSNPSEKDFEGKKLTNREILSYLNVEAGGKSFGGGGQTMPSHFDTGGEVGEPIEYKGGEVILTKKAFTNPKKYNYKGRMMTSRQIASDINSESGGLSFGDGGTTCGCSYGLGGVTDTYAADALNYINNLTKSIYGT